MTFPVRSKAHATLILAAAMGPSAALATDIIGVMPAALDQPRINAIIRYPLGNVGVTDPLHTDEFGSKTFNIQAFYDTGASGVLISAQTAEFLGLPGESGIRRQTHNGQPVIFEDVGVAGSEHFEVSVPLHIQVAKYHPDAEQQIFDAEEQFTNTGSTANVNNIYRQSFGPLRTQIAEPPDNPLLEGLDVFGMPLMKGKVVVMDPKPVDAFFETMRTYAYDPGTPFDKPNAGTEPGIPQTRRHVKLSYGSFGEFTKVTPTGAPGPTLEHNPFIGPDPVNPAGDTTPPIKMTYNGREATGSFLLDTGAGASMISVNRLNALGLTLNDDNPEDPYIREIPRDEQFTLDIGGIGGTKRVTGFFLSSMLLRTNEGNPANDNDPNHIRFIDAPVLVNDITVVNPDTGRQLTLDGIFGMNYLVATAFVTQGGPGGLPGFGALTPSPFDWAVFDEPNGLLGLSPRIPGDANRDGVVDFADLVALAQNYNSEAETPTPWSEADFDGDGIIGFSDLVALAQHYGATDLLGGDVLNLPHYELELGSPASAVPEPVGLVLLPALAMLLRRRRR